MRRSVRSAGDPQPVDLRAGLDRARRPHRVGDVLDCPLAERSAQPFELVHGHAEPRLAPELDADPLVREARGPQRRGEQLARALLERRVALDPEPEVLGALRDERRQHQQRLAIGGHDRRQHARVGRPQRRLPVRGDVLEVRALGQDRGRQAP
jgi:hypothetical protein